MRERRLMSLLFLIRKTNLNSNNNNIQTVIYHGRKDVCFIY